MKWLATVGSRILWVLRRPILRVLFRFGRLPKVRGITLVACAGDSPFYEERLEQALVDLERIDPEVYVSGPGKWRGIFIDNLPKNVAGRRELEVRSVTFDATYIRENSSVMVGALVAMQAAIWHMMPDTEPGTPEGWQKLQDDAGRYAQWFQVQLQKSAS